MQLSPFLFFFSPVLVLASIFLYSHVGPSEAPSHDMGQVGSFHLRCSHAISKVCSYPNCMAGAVPCAGSESSEQDRQGTCFLEAFILGRKTDDKGASVCMCVCLYTMSISDKFYIEN